MFFGHFDFDAHPQISKHPNPTNEDYHGMVGLHTHPVRGGIRNVVDLTQKELHVHTDIGTHTYSITSIPEAECRDLFGLEGVPWDTICNDGFCLRWHLGCTQVKLNKRTNECKTIQTYETIPK